jgi:hypothetical protein
MIPTILYYIFAFIIFMHGLVHLFYFLSYWQIYNFDEFPYKTTVLFSRVDLGSVGIRIFGLLFLVVTVGFVIAAVGMAFDTEWWRTLMAVMALLSLVLTLLDFKMAYGGPIVNILILLLILFYPSPGS